MGAIKGDVAHIGGGSFLEATKNSGQWGYIGIMEMTIEAVSCLGLRND